jgi:hypothetical protein
LARCVGEKRLGPAHQSGAIACILPRRSHSFNQVSPAGESVMFTLAGSADYAWQWEATTIDSTSVQAAISAAANRTAGGIRPLMDTRMLAQIELTGCFSLA